MNPFDVFTVAEISEAINIVPNTYGRLNQLGLMPVKGALSSTIVIEEKNGVLTMIPSQEQGGPGVKGKVGKRNVRTFKIPQLIYEEAILPEELRNVRAFGEESEALLADLLNEKLVTARSKHDITLEFLRMGALKGQIIDGDGSTVLYDLHTEFGTTQVSVDFLLGTAGTLVANKCREVVRAVEDNLKGEIMSGIHALVSQEFYDKLVTHPKVEAAFANHAAAMERIGGDMRKGFTFGGITFEEYRGVATNSAGTSSRFIAANEGFAFPLGTQQTFRTFAGPADFNEEVGKIGQMYYAKVVEAKFGRGYDAHTQSNPLPMCMRPKAVIKLTTSN